MEILPVLNTEILQQKANEFAMTGATKTLEEFYSGYNSPYRKAIEESLKNKTVVGALELPDIVAILNEKISCEIDIIANTAISKSFLPMAKRLLTRADDEILFSKILKEFIEISDAKNIDELEVEIKESHHGWLDISLSGKKEYKLTLHEDWETTKDVNKKYKLLSLPYSDGNCNQIMKLSVAEGATLELPFTRDILKDNFISFIATLVISGSQITMDCRDFNEEMFPQHCHCD